MIRISAEPQLDSNRILGPVVFRKTKDVEYTVVLPFDPIKNSKNVCGAAVQSLLDGTVSILDSLDINTSEFRTKRESITAHICSDRSMFKC